MEKLIVLILIFMTFGCNKDSNEIKLIRPVNEQYIYVKKLFSSASENTARIFDMSDEQVKRVSKTLEGIKEILKNSDYSFEIETIPKGIQFQPNLFLYTLYINEVGKITNVVVITSPSKKVDSYVVDQMKNWEMEVLKINEKPHKYVINWELTLFKPKNEDNISLLFSNLKVSESIDTNIEDIYFVAVEDMPEPIGGIKGIQEKIHYPEIAKLAGIEGRVYVKAFIDEKGNVTNAEIIKGIGAGCNEEALKAVRETKFIPGRQRGKAVKVQVSIPILFKLDSKNFESDSKIVGKWEGKSNKDEIIKIKFFSDGTTNLFKSKSGRMNGKITGAVFWPKFKINYDKKPNTLDLIYESEKISKCVVKFLNNNEIIIGLSKKLNERPVNFNQNNIGETWKLKRVK